MLLIYTDSVSFASYAPCGFCRLHRMSTHVACLSVSLGIWSLSTSATAALMHVSHVLHMRGTCIISVATCHTAAFAMRPSSQMAERAPRCRSHF